MNEQRRPVPLRITCTLCSGAKDPNPDLIPARERYLGTHIKKVRGIAEKRNSPLYILSGKHGIIPAEKLIHNYDAQLLPNEVIFYRMMLCEQIKRYDLRRVDFYTKHKPSWRIYLDALTWAADRQKIDVAVFHLMDSD